MVSLLLLASSMMISADDAEKDLKALQGSWKIVSAIDRGKPVPKDELMEDHYFEFKDNSIIIHQGKEQAKSSFKMDITTKPKTIIVDIPGEKNVKIEMIYEFDGETMKLAFDKNRRIRPNSFEINKGDDFQIFVMERRK